MFRTCVRLFTLGCFFHFAGIHNGYSQIRVSAPDFGRSAVSAASLVQSPLVLFRTQALRSSLNCLTLEISRVTFQTARLIRSMTAGFSGRMEATLSSAAGRLSLGAKTILQIDHFSSLIDKREQYQHLKKRADPLLGSGIRADAPTRQFSRSIDNLWRDGGIGRTPMRLTARSDTGDAALRISYASFN